VVGCTLPVEQFYNRGDASQPVNLTRIQAKKDNLMGGCTNAYGAYEPPVIMSVTVYPEALPAYYYCATREEGNQSYPEEHKTLVVDLGEFTADYAIISTGDEIVDFSTHEHGIHLMVSHFRTLLARERHIEDVQSMPDSDVKAVISRGYIGSSLETPQAIAARIDVSDLVTEAAEYLNNMLQADTAGKGLLVTQCVAGGMLLKECGVLDTLIMLDQHPAYLAGTPSVRRNILINELLALLGQPSTSQPESDVVTAKPVTPVVEEVPVQHAPQTVQTPPTETKQTPAHRPALPKMGQ